MGGKRTHRDAAPHAEDAAIWFHGRLQLRPPTPLTAALLARPAGRPLAFRDRTGCGAKPSSRAASAALLKLRRTRGQRPLHRKTRAENISVIAQNFYQTALVRKGGRAAPHGPNQACRLFV